LKRMKGLTEYVIELLKLVVRPFEKMFKMNSSTERELIPCRLELKRLLVSYKQVIKRGSIFSNFIN
jgi:hypothetical protein